MAIEQCPGFRRVLVAVGLMSKRGRLALARARTLPCTAPLTLLHVVPTSRGTTRLRIERAARAALKELAARHGGGSAIHTVVARGDSSEQIVAHAMDEQVDLVVIGRHERTSPVRDFFLGTTAERVVRGSRIPVLVVDSAPDSPYELPLVAMDLGTSSLRALEVALRVAGQARHVDVVHAFEAPYEMLYRSRHMRLPPEEIAEYRRKCRDEAKSAIEHVLPRFERPGVRFQVTLRLGEPRRIVLTEARKRNSDLIALGTHGRSPLGRTFLGSVASEVLRAARCDVLVAGPR